MYELYTNKGRERYLHNIHDDMLQSVYIMRRVSLFSSICSSLYISLFCILAETQILSFLPIVWCISSVCMTLNFVRNRNFLHTQYSKICGLLKVNRNASVTARTAVNGNPKKIAFVNSANKILQTAETTTKEQQQMDNAEIIVAIDENKVIENEHTKTTTFSATPSESKWYTSLKNKIATPLTTEIAPNFTLSPIKLPNSAGSPCRKMSKAMELLGLHGQIQITSPSNKEMYDAQSQILCAIYSPPRTPFPSVFNHLNTKRSFPNAPIKQCEATVEGMDDAKVVCDDQMIPVSAKKPKLFMTKISTECQIVTESNSLPKSPFSKSKLDEKQSPLLSEHSDEGIPDYTVAKMEKICIDGSNSTDKDPEIDISDSEEIPEPTECPTKSVRFHHPRSASDNLHRADIRALDTKRKKNELNEKNSKRKYSLFSPRFITKSQSVRQSGSGGGIKRFEFEQGTNDIIPMFKSLACNGLFSDKKVNSVEQLRAYNMQ